MVEQRVGCMLRTLLLKRDMHAACSIPPTVQELEAGGEGEEGEQLERRLRGGGPAEGHDQHCLWREGGEASKNAVQRGERSDEPNRGIEQEGTEMRAASCRVNGRG